MTAKDLSFVMIVLLACGEPAVDPGPAGGPSSVLEPFSTCEPERRLGRFEVSLKAGFTAVQGRVANGVRPVDVPEVTMEEGGCELLRPKTLFCDPSCPGGQTCDDDGQCVLLPSNVSVGTVTIEGLSAPVAMDARAPVYFYNHIGDLPHPGFAQGEALSLVASGGDGAAFAVSSVGIQELEVGGDAMAMARDLPGRLSWVPGIAHDAVRMEIELNIANHGGTPARVVCLAEDSGAFEIPSVLINTLLDLGYSGFPSVSLTRVASNRVEVEGGCVGFRAQSQMVMAVEIPGLTSCSDSTDCPEDQSCQADLTCG